MELVFSVIDLPFPDDVAELTRRHLQFCRDLSPEEHVHALDDGFTDPAVTVFAARQAGQLVGIGALKHLDDDHAEIKSMHAAAVRRGQGVGMAMVVHLMAFARDRRYGRVCLETGTMEGFAPARELDRNVGFRPCPPFAGYTANPDSTCMTVKLPVLAGGRGAVRRRTRPAVAWPMVSSDRAAHWDAAYRDRRSDGVSWYQPSPATSIELIHALGLSRETAIVDVGGGASRLVDVLLDEGFSDVSVLDVSGVAMAEVRRRVGPTAATLIRADLLAWTPPRRYGLWHDRAVLHFLVDPAARNRYVEVVHLALKPGGYVVIGVFAPDGPERCSGLPVVRYSADSLSELLGPDFEVVAHRRDEHVTPAGVIQPFTWLTARLGMPP